MPEPKSVVAAWKVLPSDGVNVRAQASLAAPIVLVKDQGMLVYGRRRGDWVELDGEAGFILADCLGALPDATAAYDAVMALAGKGLAAEQVVVGAKAAAAYVAQHGFAMSGPHS